MAIAGLGDGGGSAGQDRSSCCFGVDGIGLAAAAPVGFVRLVDLDDPDPSAEQVAWQRRAVGMGALDPGSPN